MILLPFINQYSKYAKWYISLCIRGLERVNLEGYFEKHHIHPISLGGINIPSNIVRFSAREHFLAHRLLIKMTSGQDKKKMCYALSFFRTNNKNHKRFLTSRQYEQCRIALSMATKGTAPGKKCRDAVSKAKKGVPRTTREKHMLSVSLTKFILFYAVSPDELWYNGTDLRKFCSENGMSFNTIRTFKCDPFVITAGKYKGWVFSTTKIPNPENIRDEALYNASKNRSEATKSQWVLSKKKPGATIEIKIQDPYGVVHIFRSYKKVRIGTGIPESTIQTCSKKLPWIFQFGKAKGWTLLSKEIL